MERQKEANAIGIIYLILLLGNIAVCTAGILMANAGLQVRSIVLTILCEMFIIIPVILYLRKKGVNIAQSLGFHKIKFTTVLLTLLLTLAATPIYIFANILSQLFVSNTIIQGSADMIGDSAIMTLVVTTLVAPICEEVAFRGFFFNQIKGLSNVIKAALVSAVLFGLMHLNINQFCYAVVLGFIFALANEASGSTWTSVIMHFLINAVNIVVVLLAATAASAQNLDLAETAETARTQTNVLYAALPVYGIIAAVCVFLVWILLKAIAKNEGNIVSFVSALEKKDDETVVISDADEVNGIFEKEAPIRVHSVLNVPMMLGLFAGVVTMIVYQATVL